MLVELLLFSILFLLLSQRTLLFGLVVVAAEVGLEDVRFERWRLRAHGFFAQAVKHVVAQLVPALPQLDRNDGFWHPRVCFTSRHELLAGKEKEEKMDAKGEGMLPFIPRSLSSPALSHSFNESSASVCILFPFSFFYFFLAFCGSCCIRSCCCCCD